MAQTTVAQFAAELGLPTSLLLDQLKGAGVNKSALDDKLEEADKSALLDYLRKGHGSEAAPKNKITLTRKSNSEIKKTDSSGRARTIQVEVRKKRVLERPEDNVVDAEPQISQAPEAENEMLPDIQVAENSATVEVEVLEIKTAQVVEQIVTPVAVMPAVEEVAEKAQIEPSATIAPNATEVVEAKSSTIKKQVLSPEQVAIREHEAKRHATLAAMQADDVRKKQVLIQRRLDDEAKKLEDAEAAKVKAAKLSEGTLHKPVAKPGTVAKPAATKDAKKAKGNNKEWTDAENKKRGLKTRGAVTTGSNWRSPKGKNRSHQDDDAEHAFNAPTEAITYEV